MANRREFIQAGAAAITAGMPVLCSLAAASSTLPLCKVIYDERFPAARTFAGEVQRTSMTHAIRGDVHDVWYDDLYYQWKKAPAAVAGMTGYNALFLLAMFAQDVGMRVIYRAHHRPQADGRVVHEAFGPNVQDYRFAELRRESSGWGVAAARIVTAWPADARHISRARSNIADASDRGVGAGTLLSWIIAPVCRIDS
jgi:hypothetical protein